MKLTRLERNARRICYRLWNRLQHRQQKPGASDSQIKSSRKLNKQFKQLKEQITNLSITKMKPLPQFKNYDRLLKEKRLRKRLFH